FAAHQNQFILISGAAATEWFEQAGLGFRATKDLDVVLLLESLDDGFLKTFWAFVREGQYQTRQRSDGSRGYYRFMKPTISDFPSMLNSSRGRPTVSSLLRTRRSFPSLQRKMHQASQRS